jgi:hypothetical protein
MQDLYATSFEIVSADPETTFEDLTHAVARWGWRGDGAPPELVGAGAAPIVGGYEFVWERHSVPDQPDLAMEAALRHPDSDVPERLWRTVVDLSRTDVIRLTVRISRQAAELRLIPATIGQLRRPGLIPDVLGSFSCKVGGLELNATCPSIHVSAVDEFVESVLKADTRRLPVVLLAPFGGARRLFEAERVADEVAGLAHVAQLGGHLASSRLREIIGDEFRVPGGGARIYWPGFGHAEDRLRHRFWTARWLAESTLPLHRLLFELLARISVHAVPVDPTARRVREAVRQHRYEELRESGRSADELVELLEDENKSLLKANSRLETEVERLTAELETHRANYAAIAAATEPEAEPLIEEGEASVEVASWPEFVEVLPLLESDAFVITPRAREMCDPSPYPDPGRMWFHLERLAEAAGAWAMADASVGEALKPWIHVNYGIEISLFDEGSAYEFHHDGIAYSAEPHVKVDDFKDPARCGRIYFAVDSEKRRFIVDHIGLHL